MPKKIADLIAAGEVVDRPASIVKETVENSIDAGATFITVEIKNGGISYIRVTDNGSGIAKEDIRKAFLSHATSKISDAKDLNFIMTLGFRGEALASISSVSKVDVMTKTEDENLGTRYVVEGGEEISLDEVGCPNGTTIIIRELFFNTPARMKFLKKDITEANAISAVMDTMALSHPEISFRFIRDGKETLLTHGDGKLISTIYSVFSDEFAENMIEVDYSLDGIKISGYISKPLFSRPNRSMQYFFINNRYVKSKTAFFAMEEAYKNRILTGKFPSCVLNISLSGDCVDVNVHPSKLEVRFSNEKAVFNAVYYSCLNALNEKDSRPQIDLNKISSKAEFVKPNVDSFEQKSFNILTGTNFAQKKNNNFWNNISSDSYRKKDKSDAEVQFSSPNKLNLYEKNYIDSFPSNNESICKTNDKSVVDDNCEQNKDILAEIADEYEEKIQQPNIRIIGEAFKTYIIAQFGEKLCIVDKHAAHERILFERIKKESNSSVRQILLEPVAVTLDKDEYSVLLENKQTLLDAGYLIEDLKVGTVIVKECPLIISRDDVEFLICEIAGYLLDGKNIIIPEKIDWIFHSSACRGAIKAGDTTSAYEMEKFISLLLSDDSIRYCPHGRPVLIEISKRDLEKFFGRIV